MNNGCFNIIRDENLFEVSVGNSVIIIYSHHIIIRFDNIEPTWFGRLLYVMVPSILF